jgi:hypothetical protein
MSVRHSLYLLIALGLAAMLVACGGSSSNVIPPAISVTLSSPPTSLQTSATATLTALVANDSKNAGVSWTVTCGSAGACGSFNPATSTGSTATTTYTAPTAVPSGNTVTVTATSVTDTTKSTSAMMTITAPASISVTLSSAPTSLQTSATATLTAMVSNDSSNAGVSWTVTCGSVGACGSFNPTTSTGGTATTTYTAPGAVPTGNTVTVTATSVASKTASASATITITAPPPIAVTLSPPPTTLQVGGKGAFTAFVSNDSASAGVSWVVTCGSAGACGSFSAANTASGTASDFTAPTAVPTGSTVTVTATSVTDKTKSASATVSITTAITTLKNGTYVFSLSGADTATAAGPYFVAGAFVVSNGTITGGEQDFIDLNTVGTKDLFTGGSVTTTADGNLQVTLTTADAAVGVNGVETINGTMVSPFRALITEFDASTTSTGSLDVLDSSFTAPSGGYAFFVAGLDGGNPAAPVSIGGVINIDGSGTISGNGSVFDINDDGVVKQSQSFAASTVSAPDNFGRLQISLIPNTASQVTAITLVGYIIGPKHMLLVETNDTFGGTMGGTALGQGASTGTFNSASISGSSFVVDTTGVDTHGPFQVAGLLTTNSDGTTVNGTLNFNDLTGSGVQSPIAVSGTYTVDSTGRVTLSSITGGGLNITAQLYLSGAGTGVAVTMDAGDVLSGVAFQQTGGGAFAATSFFGNYGMRSNGFDFTNKFDLNSVGPVLADGVGIVTGTVDQNFLSTSSATTQRAGVTVSCAFTPNASGVFTGTITGLDVDTPANNDAFTIYMIDTTRAVAIETDAKQLTIVHFELQQ